MVDFHWKKLGKIFDPKDWPLPNGCREFAQSPQALVFEDKVRIYFSTRAIDTNGKYLSHVAFADFDKSLEKVITVSTSDVIPLGALGCFDEHGIFPISPMQHDDMIYGFTTGWSRRVSVSVETGIGLALSRDQGNTFERVGDGPILSSSLHEPCLVGDAFVRHWNGHFHMWYIYGTGWKSYAPGAAPDRTYKIGHASSHDGISWHKDEATQIIADVLGPDESQALPTVIEISGRYHMMFCYRQSFDFRSNAQRSYRLGHAVSDDLFTWRRDDNALSISGTAGEWDSDMQCYPHLLSIDNNIYLLYNGNQFGRNGFGVARLEGLS